MNDLWEKPKSYLYLMLLVVILGAISAGLTFGFIEIVNLSIGQVWDKLKIASGLD